MGLLGVPVGPPRLPHARLTPQQTADLARAVERFGLTSGN
jgi:hypothetical protein